MDKFVDYMKARLVEPSTVRGFIWLVMGSGIFGIHSSKISDISPVEAMVALAGVGSGLVGMFTKDKHTIVTNAGTVEKADEVENAHTVIESAVTNVTNETKGTS